MEATRSGIKKPSISELLSLLDKPALLSWANQQGLKGIDIKKERGKWLNKGASSHKQIEDWWRMKIPFTDTELERNYFKFIEKKTIFQMEKNIETEWFVGRYDAKIEIGGKIFICDFKSSNGVYLENKLQLVAYQMAENCDGLAVINIPSFQFNDLKIEDTKPYEEILKSLSIIYTAKKQIDGRN